MNIGTLWKLKKTVYLLALDMHAHVLNTFEPWYMDQYYLDAYIKYLYMLFHLVIESQPLLGGVVSKYTTYI